MDGTTIAAAAARTGFTPSALRFYEDHGLVQPGRSAAGYRLYDDRDVERLRFIARAKGFGLTLDEIADVLLLLDDDVCAPVQDRLRTLVADKIVDAQAHVAALVTFTAELQRAARALDTAPSTGPCSDACGCLVDEPVAAGEDTPRPSLGAAPTPGRAGWIGVALTTEAATTADPPTADRRVAVPIACTLRPEEVPHRLAAWQAVLATVERREALPDGLRLHLPSATDVGALADLAAAEQQCCGFFTFRLTLDGAGTSLDVTGPPEARPVIEALVGGAA